MAKRIKVVKIPLIFVNNEDIISCTEVPLQAERSSAGGKWIGKLFWRSEPNGDKGAGVKCSTEVMIKKQ